jgi:hypothetical protein
MKNRPFFDENLLKNFLKSPAKNKHFTEQRLYGCRHCTQSRTSSTEGTEAEMQDRMGFSHFATSSQKGPLKKTRKKPAVKEQFFSFNALRSHIKAKYADFLMLNMLLTSTNRHGVDPPGTEDFFCDVPPDYQQSQFHQPAKDDGTSQKDRDCSIVGDELNASRPGNSPSLEKS